MKTLITCDCQGSQKIDAKGLAEATGLEVPHPCTALCTRQAHRAAEALASKQALICCTQEARVFQELAEELDLPSPRLTDLRDRAGWSQDPASKLPKMTALVAETQLPAQAAKSMDVVSNGLCLILGTGEVACEAAERLAPYLGVTLLLLDPDDIPDSRVYDVITGRIRAAAGALGSFKVTIDGFREVEPGGRGPFAMSALKDGATAKCDIILDLRQAPPLFPAPEKREGYLHADPGRPQSVAAAILSASHLTGTFEKPLYVRTEPLLCAHSRAELAGCNRCLDLCPTGAIVPQGDQVAIDPMICAGCGACSAVCPSGAVSFDAPPVEETFIRIQTLARAFLQAGGEKPRLLVHDHHGAEMIRLAARYGDGLPADVIPLELRAVGAFGHAEAVAALAAGFASVTVLPGPGTDRAALGAQLTLAQAIGGDAQVKLLDTSDPDALSDALFAETVPEPVAKPIRPLGSRRQITRQAARTLQKGRKYLPLPEGAPYGAVLVDKESCTLCLSCVSLCPSGALTDNPDQPQLRFQEDACLQCGICASACPEDAIQFEPRLELTEDSLRQIVLREEEPFACTECGAHFGVRSTIERITEKLQSHSMYKDSASLRLIGMCSDCRIGAQFHSRDAPMAAQSQRHTRTTADYLKGKPQNDA